MQYGKEEVYVDSIKTEGKKRSKTPSPDSNDSDEYDFLGPCVRVITEQTNFTSNPTSARQSHLSHTPQDQSYEEYGYFEQINTCEFPQRNKRAISL